MANKPCPFCGAKRCKSGTACRRRRIKATLSPMTKEQRDTGVEIAKFKSMLGQRGLYVAMHAMDLVADGYVADVERICNVKPAFSATYRRRPNAH